MSVYGSGLPTTPNMLDDLADFLEPIYGQGIIWCGLLPETPDIAIALYEELGKAPMRTQDGTTVTAPILRIIVRGRREEVQQPRNLIQGIYDLLSTITNTPIGGNFYLGFQPMDSPEIISRDYQMRALIEVNFEVTMRRLPPL